MNGLGALCCVPRTLVHFIETSHRLSHSALLGGQALHCCIPLPAADGADGDPRRDVMKQMSVFVTLLQLPDQPWIDNLVGRVKQLNSFSISGVNLFLL